MKKYGRVDANQPEIDSAFEKLGCSVAKISSMGDGIPDRIIGIRGVNLLVEVKDGKKPPSKRKLTEQQEKFHSEWKGSVNIVKSVDDAINLINSIISI